MPQDTSKEVRYTIRVVAQKTGVNAETLRTWERRYNAVVPARSASGVRHYNDATVGRVHLLRQGTAQGHAIGQLAGLSDTELQRLVRGGATNVEPAPSTEKLVAAMFQAVDSDDLAEFERLVGTAALAFGVRPLLEEVVDPFLAEVGTRWEDGRMSIAREHAVSASLRNVLLALVRTYSRPSAKPLLLFATLSGERHEFGLLMLQLLAASQGVPTLYLGPDMPASEIAHAAITTGARVVAVSAIHIDEALHTREGISALLAVGDGRYDVWVGGRAAPTALSDLENPRLHIIANLFAYEQRVQLLKR